ncbi:hypothetical protein KJQ89_08455, partial [Campylobacter lari]|nr:hypothetical protein [Campylobacter lari]
TLNNKGTISGSRGVSIASNSTIENLNNSNTGFISSINIAGNGTVNNINNQGTINYIRLDSNSKLGTLNNNGIISSDATGIHVNSGNVDLINNKNIIKGDANGILVQRYNNDSANVKTIENTGTILGVNEVGLLVITHNGKIDLIDNKQTGLIQGGIDAIRLFASFGKIGKIEQVNNEGSIIGGQNGINIQEFSNNKGLVNYINTITNKGTILGQSGAGIYVNGANQHIKDYIKLEGSNA